jgi:hypothetical protein
MVQGKHAWSVWVPKRVGSDETKERNRRARRLRKAAYRFGCTAVRTLSAGAK